MTGGLPATTLLLLTAVRRSLMTGGRDLLTLLLPTTVRRSLATGGRSRLTPRSLAMGGRMPQTLRDPLPLTGGVVARRRLGVRAMTHQ